MPVQHSALLALTALLATTVSQSSAFMRLNAQVEVREDGQVFVQETHVFAISASQTVDGVVVRLPKTQTIAEFVALEQGRQLSVQSEDLGEWTMFNIKLSDEYSNETLSYSIRYIITNPIYEHSAEKGTIRLKLSEMINLPTTPREMQIAVTLPQEGKIASAKLLDVRSRFDKIAQNRGRVVTVAPKFESMPPLEIELDAALAQQLGWPNASGANQTSGGLPFDVLVLVIAAAVGLTPVVVFFVVKLLRGRYS